MSPHRLNEDTLEQIADDARWQERCDDIASGARRRVCVCDFAEKGDKCPLHPWRVGAAGRHRRRG